MKKLLLSLLIITASAFTCFAQHIQSFSMGGELGLPQGKAKDLYDYTAGFTLKFELPTGVKPLKFIAQIGYTDFGVKRSVKNGFDVDYLPIEVGAKLYIHQFYLEGDVGESTNLNSGYAGPRVALIYAPGIGYTIPALDFDEMDFGLRYEGRVEPGGTMGQVVLRVAYKFNF